MHTVLSLQMLTLPGGGGVMNCESLMSCISGASCMSGVSCQSDLSDHTLQLA